MTVCTQLANIFPCVDQRVRYLIQAPGAASLAEEHWVEHNAERQPVGDIGFRDDRPKPGHEYLTVLGTRDLSGPKEQG